MITQNPEVRRIWEDTRDYWYRIYADWNSQGMPEVSAKVEEYRNNEATKQANEDAVKRRDELLQDIVDHNKAAVDYQLTGTCGQATTKNILSDKEICKVTMQLNDAAKLASSTQGFIKVNTEGLKDLKDVNFEPGEWKEVKSIKASGRYEIPQHEPGAKLDGGKPDAGLLLDFRASLIAVAEVGTFGANKYSRGGWKSVLQAEERYTAALVRHLLAEEAGEIDDETGLTHASAVAWNALARLKFILERRSKSNGSHKVSRVNNAIKERAGQESYSFGERIKRSENLNGQAK